MHQLLGESTVFEIVYCTQIPSCCEVWAGGVSIQKEMKASVVIKHSVVEGYGGFVSVLNKSFE